MKERVNKKAKSAAKAAAWILKKGISFEDCLKIYGSDKEKKFPCDKSGVFLWMALSESNGELADAIKDKAGYCPRLFDFFKQEGRITDLPHVGDAVFLDIYGCGLAEHCGVVVGVGEHYVETIEGDVSANFGMLVGEIDRRLRMNGMCLGFGKMR